MLPYCKSSAFAVFSPMPLTPGILSEPVSYTHLDEGIAEATEEIYRLAGRRFNINSTRELGEILFEELNLPAGKKTKTGYSTSAAVSYTHLACRMRLACRYYEIPGKL